MQFIVSYLRNYSRRQHVRPWALSAPILVLLICLPLLRPLRHPAQIGPDESALLATVQSIVERQSLAIDQSSLVPQTRVFHLNGRTYADQPPMMAFLLSGPYWVLWSMGITLDKNPAGAMYILTLLAVTLPVAGIAGLMYRMGRLFELRRPWRVGLAMATMLGTGLIPYGLVLNPHTPAAALVLASAGCLIHISRMGHPERGGVWLITAGLCAALAAAIEPAAMFFLALFVLVIPAMRWPAALRFGGVLRYVIGAGLPLVLHLALSLMISGTFLPPRFHGELSSAPSGAPASVVAADEDEDGSPAQSPEIGRAVDVLVGRTGIFSHFPVLLLGILGMATICHRYWPVPIKMLAAASAVGVVLIVIAHVLDSDQPPPTMYGSEWLMVAAPLLLFWAGAWMRGSHRPAMWATAGTLLALSITVSFIGATNPCPPGGFEGYTPADAIRRIVKRRTPPKSPTTTPATRPGPRSTD